MNLGGAAETSAIILLIAKDMTQQAFASVSGHLDKFSSVATAAGKKLSLGLTAPLVGFGTVAANSAIQFDKAMMGVNSVLKLGANEFAKYKEEILEFSTTTSQSSKDVALAFAVLFPLAMNPRMPWKSSASQLMLLET